MIQAIIIAVVSVGAGLLMLGGNDSAPPPPPAPAVIEAPFVPLASALYWVGGRSVVCSLIWGASVKVARSRKDRQHHRQDSRSANTIRTINP